MILIFICSLSLDVSPTNFTVGEAVVFTIKLKNLSRSAVTIVFGERHISEPRGLYVGSTHTQTKYVIKTRTQNKGGRREGGIASRSIIHCNAKDLWIQ